MNAQKYFQVYRHYFFQWEDDLDVVAIPNGNTIAYRDYIVTLLENCTFGFPRFGSFLLAVLTTNPDGKNNLLAIEKVVQQVDLSDEFKKNAIAFLHLLTLLPKEYKEAKNRHILFLKLFSNAHNLLAFNENIGLIYILKEDKDAFRTIVNEKIEITKSVVYEDFRVFESLYKKYPTVENLINAFVDKIDSKELSINLEVHSKSDHLVDDLIKNEKTFHIGSLIKHIWGGLNIPYHNLLSSQQPLGGFSDLTNKGDFDRLLISEFANDDLLLQSRLSNNEALYINREIPPETNNSERIIILDVSIKNWGIPKAIAYGLLFAIANHPKTNIKSKAYVVGENCTRILTSNISEIIESLKLVEPCLLPIDGLNKLIKEFDKNRKIEVLFITTKAVFSNHEIQKKFNESQDFFNYWLVTDDLGNIDVYKKIQQSRKKIQQLQLPLKELWKTSKKKENSTSSSYEYIKEYPILFPLVSNYIKIIPTFDKKLFCLVNEYTILLNDNTNNDINKKGWQFYYFNTSIKLYGIIEIGRINGHYILLLYKKQKSELFLINLKTQKTVSTLFDTEKEKSGCFVFSPVDAYFIYHSANKCWSIEMDETENIVIIKKLEDNTNKVVELVDKKKELLTKPDHFYRSNNGILKNINSVWINEEDCLMINKHKLQINQHCEIKLYSGKNGLKKLVAEKIANNVFAFANGSTVSCNRLGIIILQGLHDENSYRVVIKSIGNNKNQLMLALKNNFKIGLLEVKNLVENVPQTINRNLSLEYATKICTQLKIEFPDIVLDIIQHQPLNIYLPSVLDKPLGVATEIENAGTNYYLPNQDNQGGTISTTMFWKQYINPFLQNIENYGTENNSNK